MDGAEAVLGWAEDAPERSERAEAKLLKGPKPSYALSSKACTSSATRELPTASASEGALSVGDSICGRPWWANVINITQNG